MDESKAIEQVAAAYEKLTRQSGRIQALEKKLSEGTITMKEGAELNDLRAKAFGRALSGSVPGIERGSREGACVGLLKDRCGDVDELALAAQKTALTRQGLNITPPTAPFEEDRARKIGRSLEDETVPDETIQRRARSATETMLRSQYDRDMKQGAETCASAGLKTYIVRDADPGCCKWCSEAAGRYTYGEEPKDVYRRHDNCSCTVVYESGRGKQNVWSKQNWSKEQEREYLRLRDEMAPKRLSAKQAQALREQVGGLTFGGNGGTIGLGFKMSAPKQTPPDFDKYAIADDPEKVEKVRQKIIDELHISPDSVNLSGIRNASVLSPFVSELVKIQERTGMSFPNIIAREVIDNDPCCIAAFQPYENRFYISSKYFNSRKALENTMKEWAKNNFLPKQAVNISYLAEHEAAHVRIPLSVLHKDRAVELFSNRNLKNRNDRNIIEYFADVVAIYNQNPMTTDTNIIYAIEYLRQEGVKI